MKRGITLVVFLGALQLAAASCGGVSASGPSLGSQTHFLRGCAGTCGGGLECVCGRCTLPCEQSSDCALLAGSASCEAVRADCSQARASCAVECSVDAECGELGAGFRCRRGQCVGEPLSPGELAPLRQALVGAPCIQEDENFASYSGANGGEINLSVAHQACGGESGICLSNHFEGRVSCPGGQPDGAAEPSCFTTAGEPVAGFVPTQLASRPPEQFVHCTCACDGSDPGCACAAGMECKQIFAPIPGGDSSLSHSYCVYPEPSAPDSAEPSERSDGLGLPPPG